MKAAIPLGQVATNGDKRRREDSDSTSRAWLLQRLAAVPVPRRSSEQFGHSRDARRRSHDRPGWTPRPAGGAPDIEVVGEASNGVEALAAIAQCAPHVVVMDLDMPAGDGATATREIAKLAHPPKVLILTMHTEEERLIPLLEGGASGFLSKDAAESEFIDAIHVIASGDVFVRPTAARLLAANARPHTHVRPPLDEAREKLALLSKREQSVLRRVAEGYSGVEIARMLGITPKTVDTYKNRIGQKLGFTHRTDYVRFALRLGLLDAGEQSAKHRRGLATSLTVRAVAAA